LKFKTFNNIVYFPKINL